MVRNSIVGRWLWSKIIEELVVERDLVSENSRTSVAFIYVLDVDVDAMSLIRLTTLLLLLLLLFCCSCPSARQEVVSIWIKVGDVLGLL